MLISLAVFMMICSGAQAYTYYWLGGTDNNWNTAENWNTINNGSGVSGVPGSGDTAIITGNDSIILSNDVTVQNLLIFTDTDTATIDLGGKNLTISTRIRLGQLDTGHLILNNGTVTTAEFDTEDDGSNSLTLNDVSFSVTSKLLVNGTGTTIISGTGTNSFNVAPDVIFYGDSADVLNFGTGITINSSKTVWTGRAGSDWNENGNWALGIPSDDSTVIIAKVTTPPDLDSTTAEIKEITIVDEAKFTISSGAALKTEKITNNGELTIKGGSITGTTATPEPAITNGNNSSIIYDGASTPVWGTEYKKLSIKSGSIVFSDDTTVEKLFTIQTAFTNNAQIFAKANVTSTGSMSGTGNLVFNSTGAQTFSAGTGTYSGIKEDKAGGSFTVEGDFSADTFTITNATSTTFSDNPQIENLTITKGGITTFSDSPVITAFSDTTNGGNYNFEGTATITNDCEILSSGTTTINGTINAANLSLKKTKLNGIINGKEITFNGAVTLGADSTVKSTLVGATTITFNSTIDGAYKLNLEVPATSNILCKGKIGSTTPLTEIEIVKAKNADFEETVNLAKLTVTEADEIHFLKAFTATDLNVVKCNKSTFDEAVSITTVSDTANSGEYKFDAGGTIASAAAFTTTGKVSFQSTMNIGSTPSYADFTHTAGQTEINGTLNAANVNLDETSITGILNGANITLGQTVLNGTINGTNITLGQTSGGPITLNGTEITLNDNLSSSGNVTINNTGLFKTESGKSLTFTGDFVQTGSGENMLGGSFSGNGTADFATNVYVYGTGAATFGTAGKTISITKNIIICRSSGTLSINADISTENIALYKGSINLNGKLVSAKDVVIFGSSYSTNDATTGISNEYAYDAARPSGWSTAEYALETTMPDGTTSISTGGTSITVDAGKIIHTGKNFYANGTTLSSTAEWFIDILSNADSTACFAEAYNSTITNCTVRRHTGTVADGTSDSTNAQIPTENCNLTGCTNFDDDDFLITDAWTTRDNVVYVKFNRPARNLNGELNGAVSNFKYFSAADNDTSYSGIAINADGSTALSNGTEPEEIFLKAQTSKTWNTDATGKSAGDTKSTDRNGNHKTAKPYIDIPRALGTSSAASQNAVVTDRFGKRLKNYSTQTPTAAKSYGTDTGAAPTYVLDKAGPVLVQVRTGQETHETELSSQMAYDAHNFIEFIYSEPVNFGDPANAGVAAKMNTSEWIPAYTAGASATANEPQNIQVSANMGIVTSTPTSTTNLQFAGLGVTVANGQIQTRKAGVDSDNATMNALYRNSTHSLKISVAGFAENVSTSGTISGTYIQWTGYIENAVLPQGAVSCTATATTPNTLITDCAKAADGTTPVYNSQIMIKSGLAVNNDEESGTCYGRWDLQAPQFVKVHKNGDRTSQNYYEAVGNGAGSTLSRIEIHVSDNPSADTYAQSYSKYWLTGFGWADSFNSSAPKSTAADNLIGGSRPFASTQNTSGGLRYCTIINQQNAFKYEVGDVSTPSQDFTAISTGASAPFFMGSSSTRHNIPVTKDNPYVNLALSDTTLPYKTTFTISYDSSSSYITDLAGNRLKSVPTMKTLDRISPDFKISFAALNQNKIFLIFVKQLTTAIQYNNTNIPESFENIIPYCFELGKISGSSWTSNNESSELQIDPSVPAKIISSKSNSHYTAIMLTMNRDATIEDIKNTYIRIKNAGTVDGHTYNATSSDPITGLSGSYVTFIQDAVGNYMPMYQAHALSDFAANGVNPQYAYNNDIEYNGQNITQNLYENGSWAVHDWNAEQKNYGTLIHDKPVTVITSVLSQEPESASDPFPFFDTTPANFTLRMYYSAAPDSGSQSTKYNSDIGDSLRIWTPKNTDAGIADEGLFPAYAATVNTNFKTLDEIPLDDTDTSKGLKFYFDETAVKDFSNGTQVSFLFGLFDSSGTTQETLCLNPILSMSGGTPSYNISNKLPLYFIRLKNPSDITSMDLWSFRIKDITEQRGGVTILNNVINVSNGEKTILRVKSNSHDTLNVIVMTLDGNVIKYLNHGTTEVGEHFFTWDGRNNAGNTVARGLYFIRVIGGGFDETRKVMVVK